VHPLCIHQQRVAPDITICEAKYDVADTYLSMNYITHLAHLRASVAAVAAVGNVLRTNLISQLRAAVTAVAAVGSLLGPGLVALAKVL